MCVCVCVCVRVRVRVRVRYCYSYWLLFDMAIMVDYNFFKILFEMYVSVVFVIRCLYSALSLTLVREKRFIRIIYNYYYYWYVV